MNYRRFTRILPSLPIDPLFDSLFVRMGEYLDRLLQPLAQKCSAYLKVSRNRMELLQGVEVDEDYILASIDVNSLYTNIK